MGKGETSCTVYIALKTNLATLEISMENPKKLKWNILYDPAIPLLGTCPKDLTPYTTDIWSQSCSYLLYSQYLKKWKQHKYPSARNGQIKCDIYSPWNIIHNNKKLNYEILQVNRWN